jgi:hypothetical protein
MGSITMGSYHLCGIRTSGTMWCEFMHGPGELMNAGRCLMRNVMTDGLKMPKSRCGVTANGGFSALRKYGIEFYEVPSYACAGLPIQTKFLKVSAGNTHTCAILLDSREPVCWGYDGVISKHDRDSKGLSVNSILPCNGWKQALADKAAALGKNATAISPRVVDISAGFGYSCAILEASRALFCWGGNTDRLGSSLTQTLTQTLTLTLTWMSSRFIKP